ncbi:hypothetical protein CIL03_10470 [Virgibacillus indicus]|uniref:DUF4129 domain-containing protein n=1 Tax=Virgibacillus indicus TaxID=2024554 RepID=A0A265NB73_9BACI|nr:hypothetical protein [Virgibacillus indicus]OZU88704.1 hypothetical protein CIL03_10470 [Virgibacillus indicus]
MQNNHPMLTFAYHFLSEAIIMFLIMLPIMYHRFLWVPYWSYLIIILLTCILFSIITARTVSYFWYIIMAPVLFGVFYLWDYPIAAAVLFPVLFVWRYISIRREEIISRENQYIIITIVLTALVSLLVRDSRIMIFPFLQIIILITGYISSHLAALKKQERREFDRMLAVYFIGFLGIGALLFFAISDGIRNSVLGIWNGLLHLLGLSLGGISNILSLIEVNEREWTSQNSDGGGEGGEYWNEPQGVSLLEESTLFVAIGFVVLLLIIALFYLKRRFRSSTKQETQNAKISYSELDPQEGGNSYSIATRIKNMFKRPEHPVRRMVLQFEKFAEKNQKGRMSFETIEDWFERIGMESDIVVYQKVRYGESDVSTQEQEALKLQLKKMEKQLTDH